MVAVSRLNSLSKEIVQAVRKTKPATLENLAATLQQNTSEKTNTEQLEQRLQELEKAGVIKSSIHNQNDEPLQTWKT